MAGVLPNRRERMLDVGERQSPSLESISNLACMTFTDATSLVPGAALSRPAPATKPAPMLNPPPFATASARTTRTNTANGANGGKVLKCKYRYFVVGFSGNQKPTPLNEMSRPLPFSGAATV